jgi:predicted nucleotide-binding protein
MIQVLAGERYAPLAICGYLLPEGYASEVRGTQRRRSSVGWLQGKPDMQKPRVFIGSSGEGLRVAEAVFASLAHSTEPTLWTHNVFRPGRYPLEELERQLKRHAFAIMVATPDDDLFKRGEMSETLRDNLLVEFGLFAGAIGRRRTFFVRPTTPDLALPSDLAGIVHAQYDAQRAARGTDDLAAAVEVPCQQIREVIREEWDLIQREAQDLGRRIRVSRQGQAMERLNGAAIQLRDALMAVQRDAFSALSDEHVFREVKQAASETVHKIVESFLEDADLVGARAELIELCDATVAALRDLPFPRELAAGPEIAKSRALDLGIGALGSFLSGGDPLHDLSQAASREADSRISSLKIRYLEWWERHSGRLQDATKRLQDKLFRAALELASTPQEPVEAEGGS